MAVATKLVVAASDRAQLTTWVRLRWTVERIPHEATHWSLRLMAKHARVSQWHVAQVWKAADLRPHRLKTYPWRARDGDVRFQAAAPPGSGGRRDGEP